MTEHEAIQALTEMQSIQRCALTPQDVIVVDCDQILGDDAIAHIKRVMTHIWPGQRILVLDKGLSLRIVRETDVDVVVEPDPGKV